MKRYAACLGVLTALVFVLNAPMSSRAEARRPHIWTQAPHRVEIDRSETAWDDGETVFLENKAGEPGWGNLVDV
ncbi:MAG: hypothetical protein M5R36_26420 [Deltaproteobacteria bacterium]|nr:hypothetical protein [Deltaproteobacteria bacterium]